VGAGGLHLAPPPPAKVQQLRAAVAHAPPGSTAPPPIPGVHKAAIKPAPGGATSLIAPAARSGREPPPKPLPIRSSAAPNLSQSPPAGQQELRPQALPSTRGPDQTPEFHRPPSPTPPPVEGRPKAPETIQGVGSAPPKVRAPEKPMERAPPPQPQGPPGRSVGPPPGQTLHTPPAVPQKTVPPTKPPPKKPSDKKDESQRGDAPS
jgi:hypothetical protein